MQTAHLLALMKEERIQGLAITPKAHVSADQEPLAHAQSVDLGAEACRIRSRCAQLRTYMPSHLETSRHILQYLREMLTHLA